MGYHHLAVATRDMRATDRFYRQAMGFELINRKVRFRDRIDWNFQGEGPLWTFHLNQFDYARDPMLSASI